MEFPDLFIESLTPDMVKKAEEELGETPETREKGLKRLRELIEKEEGFEPRTDDHYLLQFLRGRKYNIDRAFATLKHCYAFRQKHSGIYMDFIPSELKHVYDFNGCVLSPKRDSSGAQVCIMYMDRYSLDMPLTEYVASQLLISEMAMSTEATQVCGSHGIVDFKGMTFKKCMSFLNPSFVRLVSDIVMDVWPFRLKSIHLVNCPSYYSTIYNMFKSFLSKKLVKRFRIYVKDMTEMYDFIPREIIPEDLGGLLPNKMLDDFKDVILQKDKELERNRKYVYKGKPSAWHESA